MSRTNEVHQIPVPAVVRDRATLSSIDYEDAFQVTCTPGASPTAPRWAAIVLEDAPSHLRRAVLSGWRALGFELGPIPAPGFVLGWAIRRGEPELVILATESPTGVAGELVFERTSTGLLYATFVALRGNDARRAWAQIEAAHPPVVSELLSSAAAQVASNRTCPARVGACGEVS